MKLPKVDNEEIELTEDLIDAILFLEKLPRYIKRIIWQETKENI